MSHVRIVLPQQVGHHTSIVELDGHNITRDLKGFTIRAHGTQDAHRVELELNLPTLDLDAQMEVAVAASTERLLTSLGWTAPGPVQQHRQAVAEEIARALEQYIGFRDARKAAAIAREVGARTPQQRAGVCR